MAQISFTSTAGRSVATISATIMALCAGAASAAHLGFETMQGNACPGALGDQGFESCSVDDSPVIAKLEFEDNDSDDTSAPDVDSIEVNSLFPTIDGSEFSIGRAFDLDDGMGGMTDGYTFDYTRDDNDDPLITAFAAKGGNSFNLYENYDGNDFVFSATFLTPVNNGGQRAGLSNLSFYDTETMAPIPLPAGGLLLLSGLGGMAALRRKQKSG